MNKKIAAIIFILVLIIIGICFYFCNCKGNQPMNNQQETAEKSQEELFAGQISGLINTDPEFAALFNDFAFNEVAAHGNLDLKTRVMVILASTIATQSLNEYKIIAEAGLNAGLTPVEIKEIVYQSVPYLGISKVYDFLLATNEIFEQKGIPLPLEGQSTTTQATRFDKGLAAQKGIFGERIDNMRQNAPANQKHFQDYLSANCFGDYYTRGGLDIKTRELLTFSLLVSLGGADSQVRGHVQGNLNVGNDKEVLLDTVTQLLPFIGYPRTLNGIAAINEVIPENK